MDLYRNSTGGAMSMSIAILGNVRTPKYTYNYPLCWSISLCWSLPLVHDVHVPTFVAAVDPLFVGHLMIPNSHSIMELKHNHWESTSFIMASDMFIFSCCFFFFQSMIIPDLSHEFSQYPGFIYWFPMKNPGFSTKKTPRDGIPWVPGHPRHVPPTAGDGARGTASMAWRVHQDQRRGHGSWVKKTWAFPTCFPMCFPMCFRKTEDFMEKKQTDDDIW